MFLTKRIVYKHNHFSVSNDVGVPVTKTCNSAMTSFRSSKKLLQVVVRARDEIMIVTGKKPSPEPTGIVGHIMDHDRIVFFRVGLFEPVQYLGHFPFNGFA